jgi:hypothetical protein
MSLQSGFGELAAAPNTQPSMITEATRQPPPGQQFVRISRHVTLRVIVRNTRIVAICPEQIILTAT